MKKKLIIILLILVGVLIVTIIGVLVWRYYYSPTSFEIIRYRDRQYRIGFSDKMTAEQIKTEFKVDPISSGIFHRGREIYISKGDNTSSYVPTVIFLKDKNSDNFNEYALMGGP